MPALTFKHSASCREWKCYCCFSVASRNTVTERHWPHQTLSCNPVHIQLRGWDQKKAGKLSANRARARRGENTGALQVLFQLKSLLLSLGFYLVILFSPFKCHWLEEGEGDAERTNFFHFNETWWELSISIQYNHHGAGPAIAKKCRGVLLRFPHTADPARTKYTFSVSPETLLEKNPALEGREAVCSKAVYYICALS